MKGKWEGSSIVFKKIHLNFDEASELEFRSLQRTFEECKRSFNYACKFCPTFRYFIPPGARVPSLVIERLHCSLNDHLWKHPSITLAIKLNLLV